MSLNEIVVVNTTLIAETPWLSKYDTDFLIMESTEMHCITYVIIYSAMLDTPLLLFFESWGAKSDDKF